MSETVNDYAIGKDWINLNELTGHQVGIELVIQNVGYAGDIVEVAISDVEPIVGFRGVGLFQFKPLYRVTESLNPTWVRFVRYDRNVNDVGNKTVLINVQTESNINDSAVLPPDLYTINLSGNKALSVSTGLETFSSELEGSNKAILKQLQLLNARFEEAFDTKIEVSDI